MKIADLYQSVTNNIIRDLEAGVAPWTKPWKNGKATGVMPHNGATHRPYHGINVMLLWAEREAKGYSTSNWMTYRQALALGGQVRAGEKSTTVVFTKKLHIKDKETEEQRTVGMLRTYAVFNEGQIDGLTTAEPEILAPEQSIEAVEAFLDAARADIRIGGNRACYVPSHDFIALPPKVQFKGLEHFYATSLHEHVHWAGAKPRLDRDLGNRFGTKAYAAEELIAELGAAFLCAHLGIQGELRHADYIATWISLLKEDERAIFTAASKASQAADFLRSFSGELLVSE
jgi:antirestriction protein ArdC